MNLGDVSATVPALVVQNLNMFLCPACGGALNLAADRRGMECYECSRYFPCEKGVPLLFWPYAWEDSRNDVTDAIRRFYDEHPFPNYEDLDSGWSLREKAQRGVFARMLDDQIRHGARILEVGCGTGQLSNFLGMRWGRTVFATDICLNSLRLGQDFKDKNQIDNVAFVQMNLFRPVFRARSFDLVICNGVLHHTSDPFAGFKSISELVKVGGFVIVGLYNRYGRIPIDTRRLIFRLCGNRFRFLDARLRAKDLSDLRKHIWFVDQYKNPHESKHTVGEVLDWFAQSGVEFINSIPKSKAFQSFSTSERLFEPSAAGTRLDHLLVQLGMLLTGGREGGFFMMIGRKAS